MRPRKPEGRRRWILTATRTVCLAVLLASMTGGATAGAVVNTYVERQCSSSGFTGYIQVHYYYVPGSLYATVGYFSYRINKGSNWGGNSARVTVTDTAFLPTRSFFTPAGRQDNAYHVLADPTDYVRSRSEAFQFAFQFDHFPNYPRCSGVIPGL